MIFEEPVYSLIFINRYPFLLLNTSSLADLNTRLSQEPLPVTRFRPNIVVTGQTRPYEVIVIFIFFFLILFFLFSYENDAGGRLVADQNREH